MFEPTTRADAGGLIGASFILDATRRIDSVDLLRGVVMILMALDHVRDYFGAAGDQSDAIRRRRQCRCSSRVGSRTSARPRSSCSPERAPICRCAVAARPAFRGSSSRAVCGCFVLDAVVLRCLAWQFNFDFRVTLLIVLWALGWAMITLALFVRWPPRVAAVFGIVLIAGHNLLDGVSAGLVRRTRAALADSPSARPAVRRRQSSFSSSPIR